MKTTSIFFLYILINYLNPGFLQAKTNENLLIKRTVDFAITGLGSASNWDITEWVGIPQITQQPKTYNTKAKVLYSELGIYFLFHCEDELISATLMKDNLKLWEEDVIEVFLWTDETLPIYFEYQISPLNFQLTILVPNINNKFLGWLPWQYEGGRTTIHKTSIQGGIKEPGSKIDGWIAEFFIPFKLLSPLGQVPPKTGTKWRANMYRLDYDQGITRFAWQNTENNFHDYKNFGVFIFE